MTIKSQFEWIMPKETFFNLPDKKRQLIEAVAIEEFATFGIDKASINRIVERSQISKGSFYQYFEDKKDLYKHLFARIAEEKMQYMSPVLLNPESVDFFSLLRELYRSGLAFAKANPKAALVGNQIFKHKNHPIHVDIFQEAKGTATDFFAPILERAISNGEVRPDIDIALTVHILSSLNITIFEYYFEVVKNGEFDMTTIDDDIMNTVNQFIDLLKNGLGTPNTGERTND